MSERPRNEVWDALSAHFGEPRTKQEAKRRGKAVAELREAAATPEEIAITIDFCKRNFTHFTEFAICGWLSRALKEYEETKSFDNIIELAFRRGTNGHG